MLEGRVSATKTAEEGPFGDHTGYYNAVERFPVMRITAITRRKAPIYVSTYTGRPPDEPSVIGSVLNELFVPVLRRQLPEVIDCWLPPEACSYRMAVVSIRKRYPGHARRIMTVLWGMMAQFSYTKLIIVVDADIDVRRWADVAWAISTSMDPSRDLMLLDRTPIDYLDFASPEAGLGDVQLKERRRLVVIARESPLHLGHLRAMVQVTELGAIVAPPVPAFYLRPCSIAEMTDHLARRAIDLPVIADVPLSTPLGGGA